MLAVFTEDNDPYGEHDFGGVELEEQTVYWKIDYYDQSLEGLSPAPANPELTVRVLTIMLCKRVLAEGGASPSPHPLHLGG